MKQQTLNEVFAGFNNADLERTRARLLRGGSYKDLSTICLIPAREPIAPRVVQSWFALGTPMNQKFYRMILENMEVGDAYNKGIEAILGNKDLASWKYVLTLEADNCPPPDGLLKLYESMDKFDVVGGLYFTKGANGQPMIYGDPREMPKNFRPQIPLPDALQPANGLGMGFNLFKLSMFKKIPKPWFKTVQEYKYGEGMRLGTQDLYFYDQAAKFGYKFACDTRVKVGHWDQSTETMW